MSKLILGIDPGSRITGFGLIRQTEHGLQHLRHGIIRMDVDVDFSERMLQLGQSLAEVMGQHRPDIVVIEKIFLGKNADSAFKLGHARGVAMLEARRVGAEVVEYATRLVKKGVAGKGSASKEEVQFVLQNLLRIGRIQQIDASDALALAAFHAFQLQTTRLRRQAIEL